MGNSQTSAHPHGLHLADGLRRPGFSQRKRRKLKELGSRRQSTPSDRAQLDVPNDNFRSFAYAEEEEPSQPPRPSSPAPRIQINGRERGAAPAAPSPPRRPVRRASHALSLQQLSLEEGGMEPAQGPARKHRFQRNPKSAATRRMEFLAFGSNFAARSLDEAGPRGLSHSFDLDLKPLSHRARSLSPLKQMRTYSSRHIPSDESVLTSEHCAFIRISWKSALERLRASDSRSFGFLCFKRILEKSPELKSAFKVDDFDDLEQVPPDHPFIRHTGLFQNIIDLAVRNIEQLETEIAPALFTYGKRHYQHLLEDVFNEASVRLFCGQVVCTMLDVLSDQLTTDTLEAWVELMRYLGRALLNGYEYEKLARKKKFAINTKDHAFFI